MRPDHWALSQTCLRQYLSRPQTLNQDLWKHENTPAISKVIGKSSQDSINQQYKVEYRFCFCNFIYVRINNFSASCIFYSEYILRLKKTSVVKNFVPVLYWFFDLIVF